MTRDEFHKAFKTPGPVVLPVIHVLDEAQIDRNVEKVVSAGAAGAFLINHDFGKEAFLPLLAATRRRWPDLWLGANFLAVTGRDAFPDLHRMAEEAGQIDGYWADDARIDERLEAQSEATEIAGAREGAWRGLYFGGTAFKKQRPVDPADHERSARIAANWMDVVTTSGVATGEEADGGKVAAFRRGIGDRPLALASGVTPDNAESYADVDAFLVATGVSAPGEFHDLDPARLNALLAVTRDLGARR
ncbi:MAG: adenine phosphoribosyltransferase [Pseudomonadota bacterium]